LGTGTVNGRHGMASDAAIFGRKPTILLALLFALLGGCAHSTYVVLPQLPDPPAIIDASPDTQPVTSSPITTSPSPTTQPADPSAEIPTGWIPAVHEQCWHCIVVHHSAGETGNAEAFDQYHRSKGWDELGYHFVITNGNGGPDGAVQVGSRWTKQKWGAHAGGSPNNESNNFGVGICLVGDFTEHMPTQKQLDSLRKLTLFLSFRYGIAPADIIGHRDSPGASTECPGKTFYPYLVTAFREELAIAQQAAARNLASARP
jgi:hypothetical protein